MLALCSPALFVDDFHRSTDHGAVLEYDLADRNEFVFAKLRHHLNLSIFLGVCRGFDLVEPLGKNDDAADIPDDKFFC